MTAAAIREPVSMEDVRRVAELANLELKPAEEPALQRDLNAILEYVDMLGELDTTNVEPMAQVGDLLRLGIHAEGEDLRLDTVRPSINRRAVLTEAPESDGRFFKVPKVIER
jgi:aspartyl-tRNA(Asn)/glutamyl-tRNA(Gln) amidotransferase subunit C